MPTIRKRGTRWQAQVRIKEHGVIVYNASETFDKEREARYWATTLEAKLKTEGVAAYLGRSVTLGQLAKAWLTHRETSKPMSRGMQHSYRAIAMAPFFQKPAGLITAKEYTDWGTTLRQTVAPATVLHHFMVLRSICTNAESLCGVKLDLSPLDAAINTLKRSRVVAKSVARERRVSDDEIQALVEFFASQPTRMIPMGDIVQLMVHLPRRREETLNMQWSDYRGDTVVLRDTKHPTITRNEVIPVPAPARAIIERQPKFDNEPRILPYKPESVSTAFQRAVRALGIADVRLHDLRHEGISRLFEAGLGIHEVSLISGHVSWAALKRYTHLTPQKVLEKLNAGRQKAPQATAQPQKP